MGLGICICNKLPGDSDATDHRALLRASALEKFFSKMHCIILKCNLGLNIYSTVFNAIVASFTGELQMKNYKLPFRLTKKFH